MVWISLKIGSRIFQRKTDTTFENQKWTTRSEHRIQGCLSVCQPQHWNCITSLYINIRRQVLSTKNGTLLAHKHVDNNSGAVNWESLLSKEFQTLFFSSFGFIPDAEGTTGQGKTELQNHRSLSISWPKQASPLPENHKNRDCPPHKRTKIPPVTSVAANHGNQNSFPCLHCRPLPKIYRYTSKPHLAEDIHNKGVSPVNGHWRGAVSYHHHHQTEIVWFRSRYVTRLR